MFKKAGEVKVKEKSVKIDPLATPQSTLLEITQQVDELERFLLKMEHDKKECIKRVLSLKKAGDQRGAILQLRLSKILDIPLITYESLLFSLKEHQLMLQTAIIETNCQRLTETSLFMIEQLNKGLNLEYLEGAKEKLEDMSADVSERRDFYINRVRKSGEEDELLDEINEIEAQFAAEEVEFRAMSMHQPQVIEHLMR
ncbi:hypothetical protein FGO68_gene6616 [Halteria grandinella]|uniref:Uncharacterized protein n=1 Tax=Halteria grandinella TaxID=5974 RepID=A0A8J8SYH9_HALGN|nr:hypothetical protein FGO68_gene6616 [Halteria grandinella]